MEISREILDELGIKIATGDQLRTMHEFVSQGMHAPSAATANNGRSERNHGIAPFYN
jgi:hypothetical protein